MRTALRVLYAEHLALRSVVRVFMLDVKAMASGAKVKISDLRDIIQYIRDFPGRIHHPKEDQYLFKALRAYADSDLNEVLDRLEKDHHQEYDHIARLETQLTAVEQEDSGAVASFAEAAESYAKFLGEHMVLENDEVFPKAETLLSDDDWIEIDKALAENDDPLVQGSDITHQYEDLHRRILAMGAPPMGLN